MYKAYPPPCFFGISPVGTDLIAHSGSLTGAGRVFGVTGALAGVAGCVVGWVGCRAGWDGVVVGFSSGILDLTGDMK